MEKQFSATVYVIEDDKTLLIFHRKLQKWLPPGGHLNDNETPPEAAKREVREETGLEIEFLTQENIWIDDSNAKSFERPFMCLLEQIPAYQNQPSHLHMDLIYVAKPKGGVLTYNIEETEGLRWFTQEEIENLEPGKEIFSETQASLRTIFNIFSYV